MIRRHLLLPLVLALATAPVAAAPPPTLTGEALNAKVDDLQALSVPDEQAGELRVGRPGDERRLNRGFLELLAAQPDWPDEGIVVAAGRHRLESIARRLDRPGLLACDGDGCRLGAPLAVEDGATLIIDGLTLDLEQRAGAAIIAHGDLFISHSSVWGRNGEAVAATEGSAFRPFIVAYDASRTVIRDSRFAALGYDGFGVTGLAVMTSSAEDPRDRPELRMTTTLVEDLFDGIFVRGARRVEILRSKVAGSKRNGIVLRDGTRDALVADSDVMRTGPNIDNGHGIIVSRGTARAALLGNRVQSSSGSGIVVDRGTADLTIASNEIRGSGRDGVVVFESAGIDILRNTVEASGRSAVRVRSSDAVRIIDNALRGSGRVGVDLHDWSAMGRAPRDDEEPLIRPTVVSATGNRFATNQRGNCEVQGNVTVLPADQRDC